jgi:hypothetical protein
MRRPFLGQIHLHAQRSSAHALGPRLNQSVIALAVRSQWLFVCSRLGHAPSVIAFTHQFKEDPDYVRLIARKQREIGNGLN